MISARRSPSRRTLLAALAALATVSALLAPASAVQAQGSDGTLRPGEELAQGESVVSPNGQYRLILQNDGNLVLYATASDTALWDSRTVGQSDRRLVMQHDGNLVLYELPLAQLKALWHSGTHDSPGAFLTVGDDGDLNIGLDDGTVLWSTDTAVSDPVSRPDPVRQISITPGDRSLAVSWSAPGDGGSAIIDYEVRYLESEYVGCAECDNEVWEITTTARRATLTGLTNGTSYAVYVRARNAVGLGFWSTDAEGTPLASASVPGKVGRPSVTAGDGRLTVSWSAPSDGGSSITGYEVWYSPHTSSQSWTRTTTARSVTLTGLSNGISYAVYVRAKNTIGSGSWSDAAAGTPVASASVPGKVGRPSVTAGDGSLTVSWSAPSNGGATITSYGVWARSQDGTQERLQGAWNTTSVTLTGLTNGKTYNVFVRARNSVGDGPWSNSTSGTPVASASVPGKVGRPSVTAGDGSLTVSWSAPSNGGSAITGYVVRYGETADIGCGDCGPAAVMTTTSRRVTITGLTNGTSYTVSVRAKNSVGSGLWSDHAAGTPVAAATVPGKVGRPLVSAGDGSLTVSWSAPSNGGSAITGYDVRARSQDGTHEVTRGTSGTTSVTVTRLTNDKSYNVFVRARNSVGSGSWSDSASGTPVAAATAPGNVGLPSVSAGDGSLTVSWSTPSDGGSAITGYEVWYSPQTSSQSWTRTTTATSVTLTGLTNGTSYRVHVRAQNSQDFGSWSDAASGTPVGAATVPEKVAQPSLVAGDGSLTVSWWPPSDGGSAITDYDVRYVESSYIGCADCGALPWVNWQSSTVSTWRSTTITGLTNGTSYAVVVRAKNSVGAGAWSDDAWGTPVTSASVPAKPAAPSVTAGDGFLTVSWSPPVDGGSVITGYEVLYRPSASSGSYTALNTTATSIPISGLTNGTGYTVFVRAQNAEGSGEWSDAQWSTPTSGASVPGKVGLPSVTAGNGSLTASWGAPVDGGSVITGYEVLYRPSTSSGSYTALNTTATSIMIPGLTNGTGYTVFVRAQNAEGSGEWSDAASGTPTSGASAPGKPGLPSVVAGDRSLTVSWSPPADSGSAITGYEIWYSPDTSSQSWTYRTTATRATLSSLTNGTSYAVHVRAQNVHGFSDWSDGASGTPKVIKAPSKPILTLSQNGSTVTVRWVVHDNGGAPITDHPLYYRISNLPFDSEFKRTDVDREKIRENEDCLVSASFTTSTNHTSKGSDGNAVLRFDPPCNNYLESRFFRALEFRIGVKNSANLWSWSTPQRLTLMPWTRPTGKLKIRSVTIQDGDLADWLKRSRDVHVVFHDDEIRRESHYRVEWLIADEHSSCDTAEDTKKINETDAKRVDDYYNVGRGPHPSRIIAIHDVGKDPKDYCFRVVASNRLGEIRSEWLKPAPALTSAQANILNTCSTIDQQEVVSEEMHDILKTVVLARRTASWATGARFGKFMTNAGRLAKGLSWGGIALAIIDELGKCNYDLGAFLRNVPVIKEIVDGYENNLYTDIANCAGLDLDHFFECASRD